MFKTAKFILKRDPAAHSLWEVLLTYPGLHALGWYRLAHWFSQHRHYLLAAVISRHSARTTGVSIAPEAQIGHEVFIDHGIGVVIGATAVIESRVVILHGVTLGARHQTNGRRHPIIKRGAFIGAHAQLLGPIIIGENSKIGAGAVVLTDIPTAGTAVGNPAHVVQPVNARIMPMMRKRE